MAKELTFDLTRLTAGQIAAQFKAETEKDFDKMAAGMALVVVEIENRTDPITAATFTSLKYWQWKAVMSAFSEALQTQTVPDTAIEGVRYDAQKIMARDMVELQKALRQLDIATAVKFLMANVTACPAAWGKPNKVATWLNRAYYGEFMAVVSSIISDANDGEKNGSGNSIFGSPE